MRSALNSTTLFGTVLMARQASASLILIVEGQDDYSLLKHHVNERDVLLIAGSGGKVKLIEAAKIAMQRFIHGVRFLIDADYDRFTQPTASYPPNVIPSTGHDVVMDVVRSGENLLDRVIDAHSRSAVRGGSVFTSLEVREAALDLAASIAPLRILSELRGYGLNLQSFPFGKLSSVPATDHEIASLSIERSGTALTVDELVDGMRAEERHLGTVRDALVGDHDYFRALARVLRTHGVSAGHAVLWTSFLAGTLCAHLAATEWFRALSSWGEANSREVFKCPCPV